MRGFSAVDLLILDEAARISDELYLSVRPMLATSAGRLVALSTPFGRRGWWFQAWERGGDAWERYRVTAYDCPRIAPAFLAQERADMGQTWFEQEYLCVFADTAGTAFREQDIARAFEAEAVATWAL